MIDENLNFKELIVIDWSVNSLNLCGEDIISNKLLIDKKFTEMLFEKKGPRVFISFNHSSEITNNAFFLFTEKNNPFSDCYCIC